MRWQVRGLPLSDFNARGGAVGEPFAVIEEEGTRIVLVKEVVFYEGDEDQSSTKHPQMERERG